MKNSALIIVDYSNDFVADNGKLTCGLPGQQIENYISFNSRKRVVCMRFIGNIKYEYCIYLSSFEKFI